MTQPTITQEDNLDGKWSTLGWSVGISAGWGIASVKLTDTERPSPLWAASFSRQAMGGGTDLENKHASK